MTPEQNTEIRALARETYKRAMIGRPHMPDPDSDEGQRKIDRLFDILAKPFREQSAAPQQSRSDSK